MNRTISHSSYVVKYCLVFRCKPRFISKRICIIWKTHTRRLIGQANTLSDIRVEKEKFNVLDRYKILEHNFFVIFDQFTIIFTKGGSHKKATSTRRDNVTSETMKYISSLLTGLSRPQTLYNCYFFFFT